MAGVEGFEPPNAWTKTMCLTTWPHPIINNGMLQYCQVAKIWSMDYFDLLARCAQTAMYLYRLATPHCSGLYRKIHQLL